MTPLEQVRRTLEALAEAAGCGLLPMPVRRACENERQRIIAELDAERHRRDGTTAGKSSFVSLLEQPHDDATPC